MEQTQKCMCSKLVVSIFNRVQSIWADVHSRQANVKLLSHFKINGLEWDGVCNSIRFPISDSGYLNAGITSGCERTSGYFVYSLLCGNRYLLYTRFQIYCRINRQRIGFYFHLKTMVLLFFNQDHGIDGL